jgi:hypothetical protein
MHVSTTQAGLCHQSMLVRLVAALTVFRRDVAGLSVELESNGHAVLSVIEFASSVGLKRCCAFMHAPIHRECLMALCRYYGVLLLCTKHGKAELYSGLRIGDMTGSPT